MNAEQALRLERIRLLLPFLDAYDYQPLCWTSKLVQRQTLRGEVPSTRVECPDCDQGVVRRRGIPYVCESCGGRGWRKVDGYTRRVVGSVDTEVVERSYAVPCDACGGDGAFGNLRRCERCKGSGSRVVSGPVMRPWRGSGERAEERSGDAIMDAAARRSRAGSLDALIEALAELHASWASLYRLVLMADDPARLRDPLPRFHEAGLLFLEARMPDPILVPSEAYLYERRRRRGRSRELAA